MTDRALIILRLRNSDFFVNPRNDVAIRRDDIDRRAVRLA
jgi:hypothetical protein